MPTYTSYDGTELAYRVEGSGEPLVVWLGGPARDAAYLGDLAGVGHAATGRSSSRPSRHPGVAGAGPTAYAAVRLIDDLEALRAHLGLEAIDLLGHSAGHFPWVDEPALFTRLVVEALAD
jgi:proline iminopeptidase